MKNENLKKIKKLKKKIIILFLPLVLILCVLIDNKSFAALLENDTEVKPKTELTYYLKVFYDGVDKYGVESSDTTTAQINSGYIYVEDKIPNGLTFNGFVTTDDGSIGAVKKSDGTTCLGKVVDDTDGTETLDSYHGLHYDEETRTVSFKVKNLQAGCVLTVGIKTITPTIDDPDTEEVETRRDFYNYATAREDFLTVNSNTVHTWLGSNLLQLYNVTYEYTGDIPDNAPDVPSSISYATGSNVSVASDPDVLGYTFSGWSSDNVTLDNGSFSMPSSDVVLTGSFTKENTNTVSYKIDGVIPDGYITPSTKEYYESQTVNVDSLKVGDIINGYRFLGWTTNDATISDDNSFTMGTNDVVITGSFEEVTYTVTYKFYDTVLPPNSDSLLPSTKSYKPGDTVTLASVTSPSGYQFLGWYKESTFTMPEEDVVVYGEWKELSGTFRPSITKTIVDERPLYKNGDVAKYEIKITNNASFEIENVIVKEDNTNAYFISGTGYDVTSTHIATIPTLAAGSTITLYAEYDVTKADKGIINNKVSILGASASNNYELDNTDLYAEDSFSVMSQIKICKYVNALSIDENKIFQVHITNSSNSYDTWLSLKSNSCGTVYVQPDSYNILEVSPQEYQLVTVSGDITSNGEVLVVSSNKNYEVSFTNEYKKKRFLKSSDRIVNSISQ